MSFQFGDRSKQHLSQVDHHLHRLCNRALELSYMDFGIACGRRTEGEQKILVSTGKSQTMNSKHLTGEAIDFMPYMGGKFQEAWPFFYPIANAFKLASEELDTPIIWGGAWGIDLWTVRTAQEAQEAYIMSRGGNRTSWFFDGPHIELSNVKAQDHGTTHA